MSESTSIYEIPTSDRERFAEGLSPEELRQALIPVEDAEGSDKRLAALASDIGTFCLILQASTLAEAQKLAREAIECLVPAVIEQINNDDKTREHLRSCRS